MKSASRVREPSSGLAGAPGTVDEYIGARIVSGPRAACLIVPRPHCDRKFGNQYCGFRRNGGHRPAGAMRQKLIRWAQRTDAVSELWLFGSRANAV
jgi:hypothetical protein